MHLKGHVGPRKAIMDSIRCGSLPLIASDRTVSAANVLRCGLVEGGGARKAAKVADLLGAGNYDFVYFADDSQDNLDAVGSVVVDYGIEYQIVVPKLLPD